MSKKSLTAQHIANAFPLWADIRTNEQSLGRQFLNPVGNTLDEMYEQLNKVGNNYYLSTSCISDFDLYYYVRLPDTFQFDKLDGDNTEWYFTPPTVSGLIGTTYYSVNIAANNDIKSFWYDAIPTRITHETTASGACLLASGLLLHSPIPLIIPEGIIDVPNQLYVTVSGDGAYIYTDDYNTATRTLVQIDGQNRAGAHVSEELYFIHAETLRTRNEFQQGYEIRGYLTPYNTTATIRVETAGFNLEDHPAAYQLGKNDYKENVLMFWGVAPGYLSDQRLLTVRQYEASEVLNRMAGYTQKYNAVEFQAVSVSGANVNAIDLAVEPHSNRLWVVSSGTLYLFDGNLYYPPTVTMEGRNYDARSIIEPSTFHMAPGDTVVLYYVWKRPISEIQRYRIWVVKPDGTKKSIIDGEETTYITGTSSWQAGMLMSNRNIQQPDEFILTVPGDYTYCLEVGYVDGTASVDKKIVSVLTKTALAEFNLAEITGSNLPITGIDIDSEYKIWVRDAGGIKYQIKPRYDNMVIDWETKVIYFREPYEQVRIIDYDT